MTAEALVFLKDDRAKLLAVAWATMGDDRSDAAWATASGVEVYWTKRLGTSLKVNGICTTTGTDPMALKFLAAEMTKGVRRRRATV